MSAIENINEKFFNPFCCKNRYIYYDCILQLIERASELPVLYETEARNELIIYLRNCKYALDVDENAPEIGNQRTESENALAILNYFRECGWLLPREVGRTGDYLATVSPYCRKLIDAITKIFDRDANGAITNHIFSIYEILKAALEKDSGRAKRPYSNILQPLMEEEDDLKIELLMLKDNIRIIMHAVMKMADVNSFGQFLIRDQLLERFFNDYFFIKRSGVIPSYIAGIEKMLKRLHRSDIFDGMITEYVQYRDIDADAARLIIEKKFAELEGFIAYGYERDMDHIDKRINTYYNLYATRMRMLISNNQNMQQELNRFLFLLRDLPREEREEALNRIGDCSLLYSFRFAGRKSIERRKKRNPNTDSAALIISALTDEEKEKLTDEILKEYPDRYSLDNAKAYYDMVFEGREKISDHEMKNDTREDVMMIAAGVIYSGAEGFPYEVEIEDEMIETEAAEMSSLKFRRKS